MIYHMSKEVARNRADTMPALPAVVNAAVAAKYFLSRIHKRFLKSVKICENHQCGYSYVRLLPGNCAVSRLTGPVAAGAGEARTECDAENAFCASLCQKRLTTRILTSIFSIPRFLIILQKLGLTKLEVCCSSAR